MAATEEQLEWAEALGITLGGYMITVWTMTFIFFLCKFCFNLLMDHI